MKNYFLAEVGSESKKLLEKNKVDFCDMEINDEKGIVIGRDDIDNALNVLGLDIESRTKTVYEGIEKISTVTIVGERSEKKDKKWTVEISDWDGYQSSEFKQITEEILLPVVKKNVHLSVPHANTAWPEKAGSFHIFIWSSPDNEISRQRPPVEIWGCRVDCRDKAFLPSGQGIPICDDATNYAVAELVGDNLYIHHDICEDGTSRELSIYRRLLEEVVIELTLSPKEKKERLKKLAEEQAKRNREQYIKECSNRVNTTLENLREDVTGAKEKIARFQKELVKTIRRLQENESKLRFFESDNKDELEKYGLEFDKLIGLPKVIEVRVLSHGIYVFTDILFCVNPKTDKTHEIGKFRIEISTDGKRDGIKWFNLTRQVKGCKSGMQAPHIFSNGKACLGNAEEVIPELIANYEFSVVAMLAIQFVETVNVEDDAGKYIGEWPVAKFLPREKKKRR